MKVLKPKRNKGKIKNATSLEVNGLKFKSKLELFTYNKLVDAINEFESKIPKQVQLKLPKLQKVGE